MAHHVALAVLLAATSGELIFQHFNPPLTTTGAKFPFRTPLLSLAKEKFIFLSSACNQDALFYTGACQL
jgi:hypothetical protein